MANRAKLLSFHAEPVTNQNDVYESYLDFAHDPTLFVASCYPPTCPVICERKQGGKYFYVPADAGYAFQGLVLKTALMRGPEAMPPAAYETQIVRVTSQPVPGKEGTIVAQLFLSSPVPNGLGQLVVKLDGRTIKLPVMQSADARGPDKALLDDGALTTQIEAQ